MKCTHDVAFALQKRSLHIMKEKESIVGVPIQRLTSPSPHALFRIATHAQHVDPCAV